MKRIAVSALTLLIILTLYVPAAAQEAATEESLNPIERSRQDYLFQFANYNDAHDVYQTAKEAYQKFGTIASQQEAIQATKKVLALRAEVLRTHFELVKLTLLNLRDMDEGLRTAQIGKIEATQAFLTTHKENIERTNSTSEVNAESLRIERESEAMNDLAYETLTLILTGQAQGLETRTRLLLDGVVEERGQDQDVQQGASDVRRLLTSVRVSIDKIVGSVLGSDATKGGKMVSIYKDGQKEMRKVKMTLKEAAQLVQEMTRGG